MLQAAEEGEVGESRDGVVGKVDRVELVARHSEVLDGGNLVSCGVGRGGGGERRGREMACRRVREACRAWGEVR